MGDDRAKGRRLDPGAAQAAGADVRREARSRIEKLAKAVGNGEIANRISAGNASRDQMLTFITERLGIVQEIQRREVSTSQRGAHFDWWRQAADRHKNAPEPEPTRWHQVAQAYERAVQALCRGDVTRGEAMLDEARKIEERTTEQLTRLVDTRDVGEAASIDPMTFAAAAAASPACGAIAEPVQIRALLDGILNVEQTVPEMPNRRRGADPWWTLDEEEEEEEPDGAGGG